MRAPGLARAGHSASGRAPRASTLPKTSTSAWHFQGRVLRSLSVEHPGIRARQLILAGYCVVFRAHAVGQLVHDGGRGAAEGFTGGLADDVPGPGAIVIEDERSLAHRLACGTSVVIDIPEDGPCSTDVYLDLALPGGQSVKVEVDTGSDNLILNQPFAAQNSIDLQAESTRRLLGQDETGTSTLATSQPCLETSA